VDPSLASLDPKGTPGKVVIIQRHGQASKNAELRPVRLAMVDQLRALVKQGPEIVKGPGVSAEVEAEAQKVLEAWKLASREMRWFDDGLNPKGVAQAVAAGAEVGHLLKTKLGVGAPNLLVTSPFRRAWQTQLIGFSSAGFEGVSGPPGCAAVAGDGFRHVPWLALDSLAETPHAETSCMRHSKTEIKRWQPCLDVSLISEECARGTTTHAELEWQAIKQAFQGQREQREQREQGNKAVASLAEGDEPLDEAERANVSNARAFAEWLRARPEEVVWVLTHQV